jgi:hypothetical protein
MATISRGYANLLPPWSFKMTLSYIIHVLVLYQGDVFVCRFEKVTSQGPIKLKPICSTSFSESFFELIDLVFFIEFCLCKFPIYTTKHNYEL